MEHLPVGGKFKIFSDGLSYHPGTWVKPVRRANQFGQQQVDGMIASYVNNLMCDYLFQLIVSELEKLTIPPKGTG